MHRKKLMYTTNSTPLHVKESSIRLFAGDLGIGGVICIGLQRATVFSFSRNET
jgi:hypothetical protein